MILCNTGEDGSGTDRLFADDYITLNYSVNLLPGTANLYDFSNKVYVNGWYINGKKTKKFQEKTMKILLKCQEYQKEEPQN